jgi:hypothetical protein
MKKLLVFALIALVGNTPLLFAEESLLKAGARHVQELSRSETGATTAARTPLVSTPLVVVGSRAVAPAAALQGGGSKTLQSSGLGKGMKWMIAVGAAAAFLGTIYAIDNNVENTTPSSLGTRRD